MADRIRETPAVIVTNVGREDWIAELGIDGSALKRRGRVQ